MVIEVKKCQNSLRSKHYHKPWGRIPWTIIPSLNPARRENVKWAVRSCTLVLAPVLASLLERRGWVSGNDQWLQALVHCWCVGTDPWDDVTANGDFLCWPHKEGQHSLLTEERWPGLSVTGGSGQPRTHIYPLQTHSTPTSISVFSAWALVMWRLRTKPGIHLSHFRSTERSWYVGSLFLGLVNITLCWNNCAKTSVCKWDTQARVSTHD